jgi:hypothetical protein
VAHLVRSFQTCTRNRSLTTGTFNQVVKDRIARPPERRRIQSSQAHTNASLTVLETLQPYRAAQANVNACKSQNFHHISTAGIPVSGPNSASRELKLKPRVPIGFLLCGLESRTLSNPEARDGMGLPTIHARKKDWLFGPCEGGRRKIEKRSNSWRSLP